MGLKFIASKLYPTLLLFGIAGWTLALMGANSPVATSGIGIIDTAQIAVSSSAIQKAITNASGDAQKAKTDFEQKQKELQAANERYTRQQSVSTPDENERRRKEVAKLSDELEEIQFRLNREVKKAQEKMVAPMQEKIVAAIKDIAASRRLSVVLAKDNTIYHDNAIDLTKEVIARIDAK